MSRSVQADCTLILCYEAQALSVPFARVVCVAQDVFISYSHVDKSAADAACATLEAAGIRCWIAPRDIAPGAEWGEAIVEAIDHSPIMVLIFSSESSESPQIRREVERAVDRGIMIMPVRIEPAEPTRSLAYFMAGVHWLDALTPPLEQHLLALASSIKAFLQAAPRNGAGLSPQARDGPAPAMVVKPLPTEIPEQVSSQPAGRDERLSEEQRRDRQEAAHREGDERPQGSRFGGRRRGVMASVIAGAVLVAAVVAAILVGLFRTPTRSPVALTTSATAPAAAPIATIGERLRVAGDSVATPIGIPAPIDPNYGPAQLRITVTGLPSNGKVVLADGTTPITADKTLTVPMLTGLMFVPAPGAFEQSSTFAYIVKNPAGLTAPGSVTLIIRPNMTARAPARFERTQSDPTPHWWYFGVTAAEISQYISQHNARIVDLQVESLTPSGPIFTISMVSNTGPYAKSWWWWSGLNAGDIGQKARSLHARLISLSPYVDGDSLHFAAVMVSNTGADNLQWWWWFGAADMIKDRLNEVHARAIDLERYTRNGNDNYAVIAIANTGADAVPWWWLFHSSPSQIAAHLSQHHAQLLSLVRDEDGAYDATMQGDTVSEWWWYTKIDGQRLSSLLAQNRARPIEVRSYVENGSRTFDAIMIKNSNTPPAPWSTGDPSP